MSTVDGVVSLLDAASGRASVLTTDPRVSPHEGISLAFSPKGDVLAASDSRHRITLWNLASKTPRRRFAGLDAQLSAVSFSPDAAIMVASYYGRTVFWDAASGERLADTRYTDQVAPRLAFSPDGVTLAVGGIDADAVAVLDLQRLVVHGRHDSVGDLAFTPDGKALISGGYSRRLQDSGLIIWSADSGELHATAPTGAPVGEVAVSPDGTTVASAGGLRGVKLWSVGKARFRPPLDTTPGVASVAFSPDSELLAAGTDDGQILLWRVAARTPLEPAIGPPGRVDQVFFSRDGRTLISASAESPTSARVTFWDLDTRTPRKVISGPALIAISQDGGTLAASRQNDITLYDAATGRERARLRQPGVEHDGSVSLAFGPGARMLAIGAGDGTITLWDLSARSVLATLDATPWSTGEKPLVTSVAVSPDGRRLASGSLDGSVVVRVIDEHATALDLCAIAGRNFTTEEWRRFMPAKAAYHPTCLAR